MHFACSSHNSKYLLLAFLPFSRPSLRLRRPRYSRTVFQAPLASRPPGSRPLLRPGSCDAGERYWGDIQMRYRGTAVAAAAAAGKGGEEVSHSIHSTRPGLVWVLCPSCFTLVIGCSRYLGPFRIFSAQGEAGRCCCLICTSKPAPISTEYLPKLR